MPEWRYVDFEKLRKRLEWLKDKLAHMCDTNSKDYTPSVVLRSRVQGQMGEIEFILNGRLDKWK